MYNKPYIYNIYFTFTRGYIWVLFSWFNWSWFQKLIKCISPIKGYAKMVIHQSYIMHILESIKIIFEIYKKYIKVVLQAYPRFIILTIFLLLLSSLNINYIMNRTYNNWHDKKISNSNIVNLAWLFYS